jgi:sugar phosphate isomerase/epimerase
MNLGILSDEIDRDFPRAVRAGLAAGLRRFELRSVKSGRAPMCDVGDLYEVERVVRDEGITLTGFSPGLFKNVSDAAGFEREMREIYPRAAEWAARLNLAAMIVFGFRKPGATEEDGDTLSSDNPPPEIAAWLAEAGARAASDGLTLMVEPEPVCWADSGPATVALLKQADSLALRINYDPGNTAWLERRDPLDELAAMIPYISNVHVKDVIGAPRGSGVPKFAAVGCGMIDYPAHFRALKQSGYNGPISLELHLPFTPETLRRCKEGAERAYQQA